MGAAGLIGVITGLTLIITTILILSSLSVLGFNEVGLNYSNWFKNIEPKTYTHGIHFIGLGHSFIKYKL